jgi:hypothetical protein
VNSIIIILLSSQGYWFGGEEETIAINWALETPPADAVLEWRLVADGVRLADGRLRMPERNAAEPAQVRITPPAVRVRTRMRWIYRLHAAEGREELHAGEAEIHVYPRDLLASVAGRLEGLRIAVLDEGQGLPAVLAAANVPHQRVAHASELQFARVDLLLVGPDRIDATPFAQSALVAQASAGAGVIVFIQNRVPRLTDYGVARRPVPASLEWRREHPLLEGFRLEDLQSWLAAGPDLRPIQLPPDEAALEIAYWPPEAPGDEPGPVDALLVSRSIGQGRLVLCQIPLGDWKKDPRSQKFLANALAYSATRPEPTPPPSRRRDARLPEAETLPAITIPPGGIP